MASVNEKLDMSLDQISSSQPNGDAANASSYGKQRGGRRRNNNAPYGRSNPQNNNKGETKTDDPSRVLKISSGSNPKTVAGAISHISRQGECPSMLATGASSINQAIKAVAIARGYLDENKIELTCYPDFRTDKRTGLSLILTKSIRRPSPPDKDVQQLKVSKGSNPSNVAGAIANKLRDGQRVWVLAIGADSVTHAVKAISIGRKYLEADGLDISFRPEFTRVKFDDGRDCSALKLIVLAQQI